MTVATWCVSSTRWSNLQVQARRPLKVGFIAQCPEGPGATIGFSVLKYRATRLKDIWKGE